MKKNQNGFVILELILVLVVFVVVGGLVTLRYFIMRKIQAWSFFHSGNMAMAHRNRLP